MSRKIIYILLSLMPFGVAAQSPDSVGGAVLERKSIMMQGSVSNTNSAAMKVTESFGKQLSDSEIADDYVALAEQLSAGGDYVRAEDYLSRAVNLYIKEGKDEKAAQTYRELAKVYEAQGNTRKAIANFESAARTTKRRAFRKMNENDAARLRNTDNPAVQGKFIAENLSILAAGEAASGLGGAKAEAEMADAYVQMAQAQSSPEEKAAYLGMAATKSLTADKPAAGEVFKKMFASSDTRKDMAAEVVAAEEFMDYEPAAPSAANPVESLEAAYAAAISAGNLSEARQTIDRLVPLYLADDRANKALDVYTDYASKLEQAIQRDSLITQRDIFALMEDKIAQLEKERELQSELIVRQNRFNYVLLGSVAVVLVFLALISRALYAIKRKNKRIALQSLRREMNPHFLFNSLNSVNQFIAQNNELEANRYLSSYSKLMRNIMENSNNDFITLSTELEQMEEYLELEHMRFRDKFDYRIEVDDSLDSESLYVPNMVIQPQLENAVWHGLRYREGKGLLTLSFKDEGDRVCAVIEDDGIGLTKSRELKTAHQKAHRSRGMSNTVERISLLNDLYSAGITMNIAEKSGEQSGVVVSICFPKLDKQVVSKNN